MRTTKFIRVFAFFLVLITLHACSPKFNWREVRDDSTLYTVLMPDKPARLSRQIQLGQQTVTMHMSAAQIDRVSFAVGAVRLPDASGAQIALTMIKEGLVNNISGKITQEKTSASKINGKLIITTSLDISGIANNTPVRMIVKLISHDVRVYQVLVAGPEKSINTDATDIFLNSFKTI